MKIKNSNLTAAKATKNDEFYTRLSDIENELKYYKDQFKDKVVYCNCDNPSKSEFVRFFRLKFVDYGLKKLIATCITEDNSTGWAYIWDKDINGNGILDEDEVQMFPLKQNGDFRSDECIEYLKESDIVVTNPPFSCYSSDTEVLTDNGWKLIKDVDIQQDNIYSLNPETKNIEIVRAVDKLISPVNGQLLHFQSRFMDICVTSNHKMVCYDRDSYRGLVEASNIRKSHMLPIKGFNYSGNVEEYFVLPATTQKARYSRKLINVPERKIKMEAWLEFFGFWLADGCTRQGFNSQNNPRCVVSIKQADANEEYVVSLFHNIGYDCYISKAGPNTSNFNVYSKQLWEYLSQFGKSDKKFVPREFLNLDKEQLKFLYKGYINGDSHEGNNGLILSSKSKQLMSDFQEVILKLFGQIVVVTTVNAKYRNEPYVYYKISHCDTKMHNFSKYGIPEKVNYSDNVYCLTLERNHIMLVRRNGKMSWCGNCFRDYVSTLVKYDKKFLILGNNNAVTYKEIFPYIKDGKFRTGRNIISEFVLPDGKSTKQVSGLCRWFTNLLVHKADNPMELIEKYDPKKYPTYDNYAAINCDKVVDIPYDYDGVIGVPITIVDKIADDGYIHFTHTGIDDELNAKVVDSLNTPILVERERERRIFKRIIIKFIR